MLYDLAIIGGGPAGVAPVYAAQTPQDRLHQGGADNPLSRRSTELIGTVSVSGFDLAEMLKKHLLAYAGDIVDVQEGELVTKVERVVSSLSREVGHSDEPEGVFSIKTETTTYLAKTVLITAGSHRRQLTVPNADKFEHNGITYCASCDGPLFSDLDVAVIGGGNAGFETAAQLLAYCKSVTLLHKNDEFKADPVTVKKVLDNPKMKGLLSVDITGVIGEKSVTGLTYKDLKTGQDSSLSVQGIFVEIGSVPATEFVKGLIDLDKYGQVVTDPRNQRTSVEGVWAAGDVTNGLYHQNNIAAGDAVKALEDIYLFVHTS